MKTRYFWLLVAATMVFSLAGRAQSGNATLNGTVTDPTGAVIPGAHVTATNTASGMVKSGVTNSAGLYVLTALIPGTYTVAVTAQGFQRAEFRGVILAVDQQARLDAQLKVGTSTQVVAVTGETATLLQTTSSSVGDVVEGEQVVALPLNGRYFTQLLEVTPGTVPALHGELAGGLERNQMPLYDVNGQSGSFTYFRLDGIENDEREFGGANIPISIDDIAEFKIQTADFSAQYGRSPVQVDVVTKSGSNQFHGDAFEFLRNDAMDAANWAFSGPHVKNSLRRNQFGGTLGGPIKKDRLFFFFDYEGTRLAQSAPNLTSVPSVAMRNGSFPAGDIIFDPVTEQPFPNNTIPSPDFNPISQKVTQYWPAPNTPGEAVTNAAGFALQPANNFFYDSETRQTINQYTGRVDYARSAKNAYFVRYTNGSNNLLVPNFPGETITADTENLGGQNLAGSWYHNISARFINELRAGFSTDPQLYKPVDTTDYDSMFGLSSFLPGDTLTAFPDFSIGSLSMSPGGEFRPLQVGEKNFQVTDDVTWVRGTHTVQLGADIRRTNLLTSNAYIDNGGFSFKGSQTSDPRFPGTDATYCPGGSNPSACGAGNSWSDFLLGYLSFAERGTPVNGDHKYFSNWAGYINDTWRAKRNFTLDLGLRYEYQTQPHDNPPYYTEPIVTNGAFTGTIAVANESNGQISPAVVPGSLSTVPAGSIITCRQAGLPDNCLISQKNDWQPRVGFAWQLQPKTVVRGAFGTFYESYEGDAVTESCEGFPLILLTETQTLTRPPVAGTLPPLSLSNPFSSTAAVAPTYNNCAIPNRPLPESYQWNLTAERVLTANTTLSIGYIASTSQHLDQTRLGGAGEVVYNIPEPMGVVLAPSQVQKRPFPAFANVDLFTDTSNSDYESLQVLLKRRFSGGLGLSAAYTYSKDLVYMDDFSDPFNFRLDRGPANDDLTDDFVFSPIWQLPFGRGRRWALSGVTNQLAGGWQVSAIVGLHSGFPFTPTLSGVDLLNSSGTDPQNRPNRICNGQLSNPAASEWYNTSCFVAPVEPTTPGAALLPGNSGLYILRGPSAFTTDLGLSKTFPISERVSLEFRAESFNVFNHPVLGLPSAAFNPSVGASTAAEITTTDSLPRIMQFALKLHF